MCSQDTRKSIIKTAYRAFHANGINNTTLEMISRDAFVQPSTISYHFGNKDGLAEAVIMFVFDLIKSAAVQITDRSDMIIPVWICLLWKELFADSGLRRIMHEYLTSDISLKKESAHLFYREFLREFSNAFNTDEAVLPNDTELVFFHTLNNYVLKGIFESIDLIESDKTYMFYAEIDIRLKGNIINIYDDNLVSPVIRYIQDLFIQIENDTYIEKYLSFE